MFKNEINHIAFNSTMLGTHHMSIYVFKMALQLLYSGLALIFMTIGIIQEPIAGTSTVERLIDRFGLPVAMLIVVGLFLWKGLWPFIIKRIEANENMLKEQIQTAYEELKSVRNYSAEIISKQNQILIALTQSIDFIKQELIELRKSDK